MHRRQADVAEFYGLNPFELSKDQLLGLEGNMPRLQARRTRQELNMHPEIRLSVDQMYELVLAETESRDAAEHAAKEYMAGQLRSGQTPV